MEHRPKSEAPVEPAPAPEPIPIPVPAEQPKVTVRLASANIRSDIKGEQRQTEYAELAKVADAFGTQEDHTVVAADLTPHGYDTFQAATRRCSNHWNDRLEHVESRSLLLNKANGLTFPAASRTGAVSLFRDKATGKTLKVTNIHLPPHADMDTQPGVLTNLPRGAKAIIPAIETLIADSVAHPADCEVILGDVNVDLDRDLAIRDNGMVERFRAAGFVTDVEQLGDVPDTHGSNEFDWLLVKGGTWVEHATLPKRKSDHRARTATLEF